MELPDIKGRKAIFDVHLRNITLDGSIYDYSPRLAALTPGFSGADIANICNEAAIHAGRVSKKAVDMVDFEKATDRVIGEFVVHDCLVSCVVVWWTTPLSKVTLIPVCRLPAQADWRVIE